MARFLFAFFAVLFCTPLTGQQDRYALHFDKPFYTSGEVIWFTVHSPHPSLAPLPAVLRIALHDPAGAEVRHFHLRQSDTALATGYIRIPYDWPSGYYRLVLQCSPDIQSGSGAFVNALLPIYNDLEPAGLPAKDPGSDGDKVARQILKGTDSLQVGVSLDRDGYQPRMMVEATLSVKDEKGRPAPANLSVSVTDQGLTGDRRFGKEVFQSPPREQPVGSGSDFAMTFRGQVLDSTGAPRRTFSLSAYLYPLDTFLYTQTDARGYFTLPLPDFYGEAVIQFADFLSKGIQVKQRTESPQAPTKELLYTRPVVDYLRLSQKRKKVYQLYGTLETVVEPSVPDQKQMPVKPDRLIRLGDYEPFPDVPTLFRELLTPLKFRKEEGRPVAHIYNPESRQYYQGEPIFLIDGQMTGDAAYIAGLDIDNIETIALYYEPVKLSERFGRLGLGGVVALKTGASSVTMPPSVAPNRFTITGLQPPAVFPVVDPTGQPVFRPLIFWQGNLRTDSSGKVRIKFPHTDDLSNFRIKVVARNAKGQIGVGTGAYNVEQ